MLKKFLLSLAFAASFAPALGSAQDATPTESSEEAAQATAMVAETNLDADPDEQARILYLRGDRLYNEGRYEEATAAFQESFDLSGRPGLLFNLANAYERLGRLEEALQALQRFAPNAPEHQRSTVNTRISTLEERLREQDEARRAAEVAPPAPSDEVTLNAESETLTDAPAASSSSAKPIGIALLVVGAGALGGGLAAALLARSSRSSLDDACVDGFCPTSVTSDFDAEKRRALAADILLFGGGALVISGVIALIAGSSSDDDSARIDVVPTLGGASAAVSAHF